MHCLGRVTSGRTIVTSQNGLDVKCNVSGAVVFSLDTVFFHRLKGQFKT